MWKAAGIKGHNRISSTERKGIKFSFQIGEERERSEIRT